MSGLKRQLRHFVYRRLLHANDSPHRIALGAGIATFVAFSPLMGLHTIIAVALAAVARANKAVCLPVVWITNPFTAIPIYGTAWWLGRAVLTGTTDSTMVALSERLTVPPEYSGFAVFTHVFEAAFWKYLFDAVLGFGVELWVGSLLLGIPAALAAYFASRWLIIVYRRRRAERRAHRKLIRPTVKTLPGVKRAAADTVVAD